MHGEWLSENEKDRNGSAGILEVAGTPYEMGLQIGELDRQNIRRVLAHHVDAAYWPGGTLVDVSTLEFDPKKYWGPDGWAELQGMATGAGVPVENLVSHALQKYALGACSHFALEIESTGRFYHGANIDLPAVLVLRDSMAFHVQKRRPKGGIPYTLPCVSGMVFGIDGFNEEGLFVSSSMLVDVARTNRLDGTNHGVIINRLLQSCGNLKEAARFLSVVSGCGGWAIAVSQPREKRVVYAEYHGNRTMIDEKSNRFVCSNHSRLAPGSDIPEHSQLRLKRLEMLLDSDQWTKPADFQPERVLWDRYDPKSGKEARFRTMNTVFRVDHVASLWANDTGKYMLSMTQDAEQKIV